MVTHTCGLCSKVFQKKWNLVVHMKYVHDIGIDEKLITCSSCHFETRSKLKFRQHMRAKHPNQPMDRSAFELTDSNDHKLIECKLCFRVLRYQNMKMHRARVHQMVDEPNAEYDGNMCDDPIANQQRLRNLLEDKNSGYQPNNPDIANQQSSNQQTPVQQTSNQQAPAPVVEESTDTEEEVEEGGEPKKIFRCSFCPNRFNKMSTLKKHLHNDHSALDKQDYKKTCPLCQFHPLGNTVFEMVQHFGDGHNIKVENEKIHFKSVSDFFAWKLKEEAETCSKFSGRRKFSLRDTITFNCNRSGFRVSKSKGKRKSHNGFSSIKINGFCPAYIRATRNPDDTVVIQYQKTHVGHEKDFKHVYLTETERLTLANNLASKTPGNIAWHDVRGPVYYDDLVQPNSVAQKELKNARNSINVCLESKTYDQVAISAWVKEKRTSEDFSLLYFKEPGIPDDLSQFHPDDFVLFFMSNYQKETFQKHGDKIICFDGTNNVNNHNIQMYTLLVSDETYTGFPCVFMFTNRSDNYVFRFFFQKIKDCMGVLTPNVFMTDFQAWYYDAWWNIMGTNPKRLLLCLWRLTENWRSSIAENIKTKEKRRQVFKLLETLLYADSQENFKALLEDMCIKCNADPELTGFYNYFVDSYCTRLNIESWAYCYRINSEFNCHVQVDNYRHILKICRLFGSKAAMLDKTLIAILRFMGSKLTDMLLKMNQTKVLTKLHALKLHHRNCYRTDITHVSKNGDEWNVLSADRTETFHVKKIGICCETCSLPCTHCQSCYHVFSCNCHDYNFRGQMCEHIHLACRAIIAEQAEPVAPARVEPEKPEEPAEEWTDATEAEPDHHETPSETPDPVSLLEVRIQENEAQSFARALKNTPQQKLELEFSKLVSAHVKTHTDVMFVKKLLSCIKPSLNSLRKVTKVTPTVMDQQVSDVLKYAQSTTSTSTTSNSEATAQPDDSSPEATTHHTPKFSSMVHFISVNHNYAKSSTSQIQTRTRGAKRKQAFQNSSTSPKKSVPIIKFKALKPESTPVKRSTRTTKSQATTTLKTEAPVRTSTRRIILNTQKISPAEIMIQNQRKMIQIQRKLQPIKILPKPDPKLMIPVKQPIITAIVTQNPIEAAETAQKSTGSTEIQPSSTNEVTLNASSSTETGHDSSDSTDTAESSTESVEAETEPAHTMDNSKGSSETVRNPTDIIDVVESSTGLVQVQNSTETVDIAKNSVGLDKTVKNSTDPLSMEDSPRTPFYMVESIGLTSINRPDPSEGGSSSI